MTDTQNNERITCKRVLDDAVTLVKDAGLLICELSKIALAKIRTLIAAAQNRQDEKADAK